MCCVQRPSVQGVVQGHGVEFVSWFRVELLEFQIWFQGFLCSLTVTHVLAIRCRVALMLCACRDRLLCGIVFSDGRVFSRRMEVDRKDGWFRCSIVWNNGLN